MLSLIEKIDNMLWERRLGITTRGLANIDSSNSEQIHYGTIPYRAINTILNHLHLDSSDVFVDLGCGKGRVLCCAAQHSVNSSIGVEYSAPLSEIAKENVKKLRRSRSPVKVQTTEAQTFDYSVGSVFYMFHPFGPNTLREVMKELKKGLQRVPRKIRIVYVNPVHNNILQECSWLEQYERWDARTRLFLEHPVAWWQNVEHGP